MKGEGNLIDMVDKFFNDIIMLIKMSRLMLCIVLLFLFVFIVGELVNVFGIVDVCCEVFIECWLKLLIKFSLLMNILK